MISLASHLILKILNQNPTYYSAYTYSNFNQPVFFKSARNYSAFTFFLFLIVLPVIVLPKFFLSVIVLPKFFFF